ncbi:MAG: phenylalanine--tRNA ligase subunit beta [Verrucomicrobia bacterium]|nr:phenylalanine--tRNA ligase subunit beta [Verrucomicrobiota bacterium]
MKIPLSWLQEYVDVTLDADELADKLTFSGTEVEGIERIGTDVQGLIVAEITAVAPHPNADRLRLCQVHTGSETLQVVCGASNFTVGDKAAFAPVGATLPGGTKLKKAKIRGVESFGMLCAEDELGLSEAHDGIMLLDPSVAVGTPLSSVLPPPETVLHLEITWNRSDCLSVMGMAREVAALYGCSLIVPETPLREGASTIEELVSVVIDDATACPRYTGRVLEGVTVGASPAWIQRRLELCGIRPINNLVDITNYVLLECGQPLHAFDYARIKDGTIIVRRAVANEPLTTLDGVARKLSSDMLVIADPGGPQALAGIMGGSTSEISDTTTRVLLESATFAAPGIHQTAMTLGLTSESAHRFERGVDHQLADWGSRRAASLMCVHGGGTVARGVVDIYPGCAAASVVVLRADRCRSLLGIAIEDATIINILESLSFTVSVQPGQFAVTVPSFRRDIELEADLIEEIARIHGLEQVPDKLPEARLGIGVDDAPSRAVGQCRTILTGLGLSEIMNYSFLSAGLLDLASGESPDKRLVLPNPVSADYAVMRDSLIPQLVESMGRNMTHQTTDAAMFEIGTVYQQVEGRNQEERRLSIGLMGTLSVSRASMAGDDERGAMLLAIKGLVESLCDAMKCPPPDFAPDPWPGLASGWGLTIRLGDNNVGRLGLVDSAITSKWRVVGPMAVAELKLAPLLSSVFATPKSTPIAVYPGIQHDLAVIVDEPVRHERIVETIRGAAPSELTAIRLFDIFRSNGIGVARKSMAYTLFYRSLDRTLTDDEAKGFDQVIKDALKKELSAEIREG